MSRRFLLAESSDESEMGRERSITYSEPRCGNCRWWGDFTDAHMPERSCRAVEVSNLFDSVDDLGRNTMITKPAFGCVEWEAKP
jgi:hypothetical protein